MACEYCHGEGWHSCRCPIYTSPKNSYYCSICGEVINNGEEYIKNIDGEYGHYDCFNSMRELLEWLGYDIKTKEKAND